MYFIKLVIISLENDISCLYAEIEIFKKRKTNIRK
jgi:hypothetical protein